MSLGEAGCEMQGKGLWGNRFAKPYRFQKPIRLWTVLNTNDQDLTTFTPASNPYYFALLTSVRAFRKAIISLISVGVRFSLSGANV